MNSFCLDAESMLVNCFCVGGVGGRIDLDRLDIIQNTTIIYNIDDNMLIREDNQEIAGAL